MKENNFFYIFQGLPVIDDGNSHNFFCALRLVIDSQATDQQKLFPQSARTKCVKPLVSKINKLDTGTVKWNELFIFEVPRKVSYSALGFVFICFKYSVLTIMNTVYFLVNKTSITYPKKKTYEIALICAMLILFCFYVIIRIHLFHL